MGSALIAAGLLLYGLSLVVAGEPKYLAVAGGVLAGLGIARIVWSRPLRDRTLETRQLNLDADVKAATMRVLGPSRDNRSWKVIRLSTDQQ